VDFIYTEDVVPEKDPVKFWKQEGKKQCDAAENFVNKKKARSRLFRKSCPRAMPGSETAKDLCARSTGAHLSFEKENRSRS